MALFSSGRSSHKVPLHRQNTESSDPVVSDIIDLRKMKKAASSPNPPPPPQSRPTFAPRQPEKKIRQKEPPLKISQYTPKKEREPLSRKTWYIFSGIAGFIAVFILISTVFASATIIIQTKKDEFSLAKVSATIDPTLSLPDMDSRRIPGELMQFSDEVSLSFKTTGEKYIETKSHGIITITNSFSSSPQPLVQSTRFEEISSKKIYRLTKSITVPGAKVENGKIIPSTIDAEVSADQIGDAYNITQGSFTIPGFQGTPKFEGFRGTLKEAFVGGFKGTSRIVSAADLQKALDDFTKESKSVLEKKRNAGIPAGFMVLPETEKFEIVSKTAPKAGDPGETFGIKGKARLVMIAFQEKTLMDFFHTISNENAGKMSVLQDKSKITYEKAVFTNDGKLSLAVSGTLIASSRVNQASVLNVIAGKSLDAARKELRELEGVGVFGIKIFPFWRNSMPKNTSGIHVQILAD